MQGAVKIYRGSAAAARRYVEADRPRADDYYLAEGSGLAAHFVAFPNGVVGRPAMDGDAYERWVAGYDLDTGRPKGRLRRDGTAVRFVEVVVNGPKTWSLAAAMHPEIAAAYEAAQDRAAAEMMVWLAQHSTTRVGPRGRQIQVPVERLEFAKIRHYTSRAGDPHFHLHLQVNARVWAAGAWRGIHTVGVRDSINALNGIGTAAMISDPNFRAALARFGFRLNGEGEVRELARFVGAFSARTTQIGRNVDRYEADWRRAHPGEEPGRGLRRAWDARGWAEARPDKVVPRDGTEVTRGWLDELAALGFTSPTHVAPIEALLPGEVDRDAVVTKVMSRLGVRRSSWNAADVRGEVEQQIARLQVLASSAVRIELAEDLAARALNACVPLLERDDVPEHIRALTSPRVLAVEAELTTRLTTRAAAPFNRGAVNASGLDPTQRDVVAALAGQSELLVIEGAAGAGKTTVLFAANQALARRGSALVVVTPTLQAAEQASRQLGTAAFSAAWLAHQHGFRWDDDGHWTRLDPVDRRPQRQAHLWPGDVLLVDEAGMLDQDTARAVLTIADETGARLALMGDQHQLPAVGRGGVLDLAGRWATPEACLTLDTVHRFADPAYADLSLLMRTGERSGEVFDALVRRGQIVVHPTEVERRAAVTESWVADADRDQLLIADTRDEVAVLNQLIRDRLVADGRVDDARAVTTRSGQRLGVGDRVTTRRNDREIGVANRDVWTVGSLEEDGALTVVGSRGSRLLPARYVAADLELSYAATAYGAQGSTATAAQVVVGDQTSSASAYVGLTRGRHRNLAHLVADTVDDARTQWIDVFARDRADLGPTHAAALAREAVERYGSQPRSSDVALQRAALTGSLDLAGSSGHRQLADLPTRQAPRRDPPAR